MSNQAKKKNPRPNEKPSRAEMQHSFQLVAGDIQGLRVGLAWFSDFLLSKGLFTLEELDAFFKAKQAEVTAQQSTEAPVEANA